MIETINNNKFIFTYLIFLFFVVVIDVIFGNKFLDMSTSLSVKLQQLPSNFEVFFNLFTNRLSNIIYLVSYFVLILPRNKSNNVFLFSIILIVNPIKDVIKILYVDTRPCYNNTVIDVKEHCPCSFGKSSGHSFNALFFYVLFYKEFILFYLNKSNLKNKKFIKTASLTIICFIIFNVGLSRIYYGVHSFNQVILGYLYAFLCLILFYKGKDYFKNIVKNVYFSPNKGYKENKIFINQNNYLKVSFIIITLVGLLFLGTIIFYININYRSNYFKITNPKCKACKDPKTSFNYKTIFPFFSFTLINVGFYIGFLFKSVQEKFYYIYKYGNKQIVYIISFFIFIFYQLIQYIESNIEYKDNNIIAKVAVKSIFYLLTGLYINLAYPYLITLLVHIDKEQHLYSNNKSMELEI